ncbi:hypothetical protein EMCRGX_G005193 [Ephydatia muelleri]
MVAAKTFFFDTGPGCEKYYAFSQKASDLYELVANINQGNLQDQAGNKKSNGMVPSSARPSMDREQGSQVVSSPQNVHALAGLEMVPQPNPWPNYTISYGRYVELDISSSATAITSLEGRKTTLEGASRKVTIAERPKDKEVVYGSLDFDAMKTLERMQKERELLKQGGGKPMS